MIIDYKSKKVEQAVNDYHLNSGPLEKILKKAKAGELCTCMDVIKTLEALHSSDSCAAIPPSYCLESLTGNREGTFSVVIKCRSRKRGKFRMTFYPTHPNEVVNGNLRLITSITIDDLIVDYH